MLVYLFALILLAQGTEARLRIKVVSIHPCKLPQSVLDPDQPVKVNLTIRKVSRDLTVLDCDVEMRKYGPVSYSFKSYQMLQNGHRNLIFKLEKVSCKNPMTLKLTEFLHVKIDKQCNMDAGKFHFENLDVDNFGFFLTRSTNQPGKYSFELTFNSPKGVVVCFYIVGDIVTVKQKPKK